MRRIQLAGLLLALSAAAALAQNASVSGTVADQTGARIAGATVTALNADTGVVSPTTTNQSGVYVFASLPPGTYTFNAEHAGFRRESVANVILEIGSQLTVNMGLQLGQANETVEVQATAEQVNASSATVGDVVTGKQLQDLPLVGRSAYNLITTQPGVVGTQAGVVGGGNVNFYLNGNQGNAINYTMDGINAMNNLLTGSFYNYSNFVSQDRTEEARIVTSPADAEYGRGVGQVQMVTRGGTNRFVGSAWEEFRNTDLNANDFFNNARGNDPVTGAPISPRTILVQNNYGIRFGGPLKKNKTFFNGIYDPYKQRQQANFTANVYTQSARNGIFRYYPGAQNNNAAAANPSVDLAGNPVAPAGATGPLQSLSVFGVDPNRLGPDPTGIVAKNLALMPLPNNFRVGDGLNTAGYTWNRPIPVNFELYEGRIDHIINDQNRISITLNQQSYHSINVATPPPYPSVPWQADPTETTQYSFALTSVIRPTLINEVRIGVFRPRTTVQTPFTQTPSIGPVDNKGILPVIGGVPFVLCYSGSGAAATNTSCAAGTSQVTTPLGGNASNYIAPVYQYGDALTWVRGKHSFKTGVEVRLISDAGYDANGVTPNVVLGANGSQPVTGIGSFPGIGANVALAQNLLTDLAGSVVSANMTNFSSGGANPVFTPGLTRYREWHQNEMSWYLKDDFKLKPNLTLNLGVRYELYLAPYEAQGKGLAPVGGAGSVFGISGTSFATGEFQPGVMTGSPTVIQNIGPGSTHPDGVFYHTDYKNFAPAVGFAWALQNDSLRWLTGGKDQTTVRMGYGIGYQRLPIYLTHYDSGFEPGLAEGDTSTSATNLSNLVLPVPPTGAPLATIPTVGPGSHTQSLLAYDLNVRTPYVQNYNVSIQRAINQSTSFQISFVGSKGTKLLRSIDTNQVDVLNNGFLQAFQTVQAGGDSALMDQIFGNLPVATAAAAVKAAGNGSNYLRTNSATYSFLANNNVGGLANYINTTNFGTNLVGGLVPNAKLPANFFVANPQFLSTYLTGNFGNSTYNSLQLSATHRFSGGLLMQGSYVWSKALGEDDGESSTLQAAYRTLTNMSLDKTLLSFDHRQVFKLNGIYELPVGRGRRFGKNMNAILDGAIGGWQMGWNYNYFTGAPFTVTAQNTLTNAAFTLVAGYTPNLVGQMPTTEVTRLPGYVTYFPGLTQIPDPSRSTLTGVGGLNTRSTLFAIANSSGQPVFVNPAAGQLGNLGLNAFTAPPGNQLDLNVQKNFRITERFNFQLRATASNALNHVQFAPPTNAAATAFNQTINTPTFGRITTTAAPARILVLQARLNF